jgi:hypothetical protein
VCQPVPTIQSPSFREFSQLFLAYPLIQSGQSFEQFREAVETDPLILDVRHEGTLDVEIYRHRRSLRVNTSVANSLKADLKYVLATMEARVRIAFALFTVILERHLRSNCIDAGSV